MRDYWLNSHRDTRIVFEVSVVGFLDEGLLVIAKIITFRSSEFQWLDF